MATYQAIIFLKNDVFRVVGRYVGASVWQFAEMASRVVLPYLVAAGFARDTDPHLRAISDAVRYSADQVTNFPPVSWVARVSQAIDWITTKIFTVIDSVMNSFNRIPGYRFLTGFPLFLGHLNPTYQAVKNSAMMQYLRQTELRPIVLAKKLYQTIDGGVSTVLSTIDRGMNTLNVVPGYRLLTGFPLFLGNWDQKYTEAKNFLIIGSLWQHTAAPLLNQHVWVPYAKVASSYAAPYADAALRYGDEKIRQAVSGYTGAEDFLLQALNRSCAAQQGWFYSVVCGGSAPNISDEKINLFAFISTSTDALEKLGEAHLEKILLAKDQMLAMLSHGNEYVGQLLTSVANGISYMALDIQSYGECIIYRDGFPTCTKNGLNYIWSGYATPAYNMVYENGLKQCMEAIQNNGYAAPIIAFVCNRIQDLSNYHQCIMSPDKGLQLCTSNVYNEIYTGCMQPAWEASYHIVLTSARFLWENTMQVLIDKSSQLSKDAHDAAQPYALPVLMGLVGLSVAGLTAKFCYERGIRQNQNQQQHIHIALAGVAPAGP